MLYSGENGYQYYIIAITSDIFESNGHYYARFLRASSIFRDVQKMEKKLNGNETPITVPSKRRKIKQME